MKRFRAITLIATLLLASRAWPQEQAPPFKCTIGSQGPKGDLLIHQGPVKLKIGETQDEQAVEVAEIEGIKFLISSPMTAGPAVLHLTADSKEAQVTSKRVLTSLDEMITLDYTLKSSNTTITVLCHF